MSAPGVTVWRMDVGVIVYCAELEAPALRETARRILEAEAARFGVSLEPAELVRHLAATEPDPLAEDGPLMVLARAGALALVSRAEVARSVVHR
jgi:hypothetical protein